MSKLIHTFVNDRLNSYKYLHTFCIGITNCQVYYYIHSNRSKTPSETFSSEKTMFLSSVQNKRFIHILLICACIINLCYVVFNILNPKLPKIKNYKKLLKDIQFPISFEVCLNEVNVSISKYHEYGYENSFNFFKGISKYNTSLIGWAGHSNNYSILGSVKGKIIKDIIIIIITYIFKFTVIRNSEYVHITMFTGTKQPKGLKTFPLSASLMLD